MLQGAAALVANVYIIREETGCIHYLSLSRLPYTTILLTYLPPGRFAGAEALWRHVLADLLAPRHTDAQRAGAAGAHADLRGADCGRGVGRLRSNIKRSA